QGETPVLHLADASYKGGEGADDWNKPRQDNRLAAVFFVKVLRAQQVLLVQQPGILVFEDFWSQPETDGVIDGIAHYGRDAQQDQKQWQRQSRFAIRRQCPDREEQRITRQEWGDNKARLAENDGKQHHIEPGAHVSSPHVEVHIQVLEYVDEVKHPFHIGFAP